MQRIRIVGLALVAVFALSAVVSASASAAFKLEWGLGGVLAPSNMPTTSHGTLKLTDSKTTIGSVTIECAGIDKGTVGSKGIDEVTSITNAEGKLPIKCTSTNKECETPTAEPIGLPWKTQLVEREGKEEDQITSAKEFGWKSECTVKKIVKAADECTTKETHTVMENVAAGVNSIFSPAVGGKAKCTQSKEETGSVEGTDVNEGGEGAKLEAL
jgi:hypothetical protein